MSYHKYGLNNTQKNSGKSVPALSGWYVARTVGELGFIIALPLIVLLLSGRLVDRQLGTKVIFTLLSLPVSLGISTYIIYKKIESINK